jgi:hypothetical protein
VPKKSLRSSKGGGSIPGQVEKRLEPSAAVWKRRCEGATYSTLMREFGVSKTSIHNYIEDARAILREETQEMAARERAQALELLDNAIEKITPHINGEIVIETKIQGKKGPITITVEEWQARIQACGALVKLLDRKSKLLGMDAPVKVEAPPVVAPETEEQRARAREALKMWTKFSVDPKDFQSRELS